MWHWKQKATQKAKYEVQVERDPRFVKPAPPTILHPEARNSDYTFQLTYEYCQRNSLNKREEVKAATNILVRTPCGVWVFNGKIFVAGVVMNRHQMEDASIARLRQARSYVQTFCFGCQPHEQRSKMIILHVTSVATSGMN